MASLELLPMWSGVDPDMELFASGVVREDEGDWGVGGQSLEAPPQEVKEEQQEEAGKEEPPAADNGKGKGPAPAAADKGKGPASAAADKGKGPAAGGSGSLGAGGSSSAAAAGSSKAGGSSSAAAAAGSSKAGGSSSSAAAAGGSSSAPAAAAAAAPAAAAAEEPAPEGMRMYLSQIREWVVEFSADMLFLSIRTDAAWYRLVRPAPKYAPWYQVPLKAARIAVKVSLTVG